MGEARRRPGNHQFRHRDGKTRRARSRGRLRRRLAATVRGPGTWAAAYAVGRNNDHGCALGRTGTRCPIGYCRAIPGGHRHSAQAVAASLRRIQLSTQGAGDSLGYLVRRQGRVSARRWAARLRPRATGEGACRMIFIGIPGHGKLAPRASGVRLQRNSGRRRLSSTRRGERLRTLADRFIVTVIPNLAKGCRRICADRKRGHACRLPSAGMGHEPHCGQAFVAKPQVC